MVPLRSGLQASVCHFRYSWCSEELCIKKNRLELLLTKSDSLRLEDMIPLESKPGQCDGFEQRQKLVIGHNVAFDRSYVKEQYFLEVSRSVG